MEPELVPRVFDLFTQAERTSDRTQGGLGIGLALVKSLVQLHNGTVMAESEGAGRGSTFTVRLPLVLQPGESAADRQKSGVPSKVRKCLVVDDNVDAAQTLAMLLEATGHQVSVAYTAAEGLALAIKESPEVCLLDLGLPDFDGIELVGMLRHLPGLESALMIAVTGYGRKEDREKALAAGFTHYFVKPIQMIDLEALLGTD